jgi:hypothetical protein
MNVEQRTYSNRRFQGCSSHVKQWPIEISVLLVAGRAEAMDTPKAATMRNDGEYSLLVGIEFDISKP